MTPDTYKQTASLFAAADTATSEHTTTLAVLEALVDGFSLPTVVSALADLCDEKAEHVATAWQDTTLAKTWAQAAVALNRAALKLPALP